MEVLLSGPPLNHQPPSTATPLPSSLPESYGSSSISSAPPPPDFLFSAPVSPPSVGTGEKEILLTKLAEIFAPYEQRDDAWDHLLQLLAEEILALDLGTRESEALELLAEATLFNSSSDEADDLDGATRLREQLHEKLDLDRLVKEQGNIARATKKVQTIRRCTAKIAAAARVEELLDALVISCKEGLYRLPPQEMRAKILGQQELQSIPSVRAPRLENLDWFMRGFGGIVVDGMHDFTNRASPKMAAKKMQKEMNKQFPKSSDLSRQKLRQASQAVFDLAEDYDRISHGIETCALDHAYTQMRNYFAILRQNSQFLWTSEIAHSTKGELDAMRRAVLRVIASLEELEPLRKRLEKALQNLKEARLGVAGAEKLSKHIELEKLLSKEQIESDECKSIAGYFARMLSHSVRRLALVEKELTPPSLPRQKRRNAAAIARQQAKREPIVEVADHPPSEEEEVETESLAVRASSPIVEKQRSPAEELFFKLDQLLIKTQPFLRKEMEISSSRLLLLRALRLFLQPPREIHSPEELYGQIAEEMGTLSLLTEQMLSFLTLSQDSHASHVTIQRARKDPRLKELLGKWEARALSLSRLHLYFRHVEKAKQTEGPYEAVVPALASELLIKRVATLPGRFQTMRVHAFRDALQFAWDLLHRLHGGKKIPILPQLPPLQELRYRPTSSTLITAPLQAKQGDFLTINLQGLWAQFQYDVRQEPGQHLLDHNATMAWQAMNGHQLLEALLHHSMHEKNIGVPFDPEHNLMPLCGKLGIEITNTDKLHFLESGGLVLQMRYPGSSALSKGKGATACCAIFYKVGQMLEGAVRPGSDPKIDGIASLLDVEPGFQPVLGGGAGTIADKLGQEIGEEREQIRKLVLELYTELTR